MSSSILTIEVGQTADDFMQANMGTFDPSRIDRQPAGLNFYEHHWPTDRPGTVSVSHGALSFDVPHALGAMGRENPERASNGIEEFNIYAGVTADETISHDEARIVFTAFLQTLLRLGWKPLIGYNYPRLRGEHAFRYYQEDDAYTVPLDYEPTLDEWMNIDFGSWRLFADDVYMSISFERDRSRMDPQQSGAYLLTVTLYSKDERAKSYFQGKDRNDWQELWVDRVKELKRERYRKEAELKERGFTIFTEYEEPLIHPEDPVEP